MRIEPLFNEEAVQRRIGEFADRLARDYSDSPLTLACISQGARRFVDDLMSQLATRGVEAKRLDIRTHRDEGALQGPVQVEHFDPEVLDGRDVVLADDIADEGAKLRAVLEIVSLAEPRSVRHAALIEKRARRAVDLPIDYAAFQIDAGMVIGYGMDVDGEYQDLDWIGLLKDDRF